MLSYWLLVRAAAWAAMSSRAGAGCTTRPGVRLILNGDPVKVSGVPCSSWICTNMPLGDARYFQIAALGCLLALNITLIEFGARPLQSAVAAKSPTIRVIPGATSVEQLKTTVGAAEIVLSSQEMVGLDKLDTT
jgi:hypothetical protein